MRISDWSLDVCSSDLRLSLEAGQAHYSISGQELNALGQTVGTTTYATAVALPVVSEAAIAAAVGAGDPSRDRITRFLHALAGRQIFRLSAVSVEADQSHYRVHAQRFDAFGPAVGSNHSAGAGARALGTEPCLETVGQ